MNLNKVKKTLSRIPPDAMIAVVLFIVAATVGITYLFTWGGRPQFWQPIFGPAAMWACGRGYENPALSQAPDLEDFLYQRSDCLCCEDLPEALDVAPRGPYFDPHFDWDKYFAAPGMAELIPYQYQYFHLYLLGSAALIWRVFGVSWSGLYPFFALLYGTTVTIGYGLFRLGMRRVFAIICALMLTVAPLHLQQLPHYRDYAKAPFILAAILIMGYIAKKPLKWPVLLGLAGLGGAVVGLGLGFRPDVNICILPFVVILLLFLPGGLLRTFKVRLSALGVFFAVYFITAWPILNALSAGSNMPHWVLLGLFSFCDIRLGVGSPLYDFGNPYSDYYIRTLFQSYSQRLHGNSERLYISTQTYDYYGLRYLLEIAKRFPADLALRGYAAVLRVLDEMRMSVQDPAPRGITNPILVAAYKARVLALNSLVGSGRYYAGLTLLLVGGYNLRLALCALFLVLYFAGYTALQFNLRHCFHLEFLSLWTLGFLAQQVVDAVRTLRAPASRGRLKTILARPAEWWRPPVQRALVFAAAACLSIVLPVAGLRMYQHYTAGALLHASATAPVEAVEFGRKDLGGDRVLLYLPDFAQLPPVPPEEAGVPARTQYLVIEFADAGRPDIPLTIRYEAEELMYDFTREDIVLPRPISDDAPEEATARVFAPAFYLSPDAYEGIEQTFKGIELAKDHLPYLRGVYRVTDLHSLALLLNLTLPHDWEEFPRHQVFLR